MAREEERPFGRLDVIVEKEDSCQEKILVDPLTASLDPEDDII